MLISKALIKRCPKCQNPISKADRISHFYATNITHSICGANLAITAFASGVNVALSVAGGLILADLFNLGVFAYAILPAVLTPTLNFLSFGYVIEDKNSSGNK
ncbi:Rcat domain-containing protein [Vibrio ulleungensis]|uniref:DUF2061 domain-containing protein n=1 Tax=Vibrio ulleungensis TaxID=2807619 RepID=A0ABS2HKW0_9VIBR|nr:hypothetical protein [Vibrio ulleungensis]MBM7037736.1 hypothetical protein [Vibrio ulleungensis]